MPLNNFLPKRLFQIFDDQVTLVYNQTPIGRWICLDENNFSPDDYYKLIIKHTRVPIRKIRVKSFFDVYALSKDFSTLHAP